MKGKLIITERHVLCLDCGKEGGTFYKALDGYKHPDCRLVRPPPAPIIAQPENVNFFHDTYKSIKHRSGNKLRQVARRERN